MKTLFEIICALIIVGAGIILGFKAWGLHHERHRVNNTIHLEMPQMLSNGIAKSYQESARTLLQPLYDNNTSKRTNIRKRQ